MPANFGDESAVWHRINGWKQSDSILVFNFVSCHHRQAKRAAEILPVAAASRSQGEENRLKALARFLPIHSGDYKIPESPTKNSDVRNAASNAAVHTSRLPVHALVTLRKSSLSQQFPSSS